VGPSNDAGNANDAVCTTATIAVAATIVAAAVGTTCTCDVGVPDAVAAFREVQSDLAEAVALKAAVGSVDVVVLDASTIDDLASNALDAADAIDAAGVGYAYAAGKCFPVDDALNDAATTSIAEAAAVATRTSNAREETAFSILGRSY
jgi:hypothetical protein